MWSDLLNSNMCWCHLWGQQHSIFTFVDWKMMIWKRKYERNVVWKIQVGEHMINYAKTQLHQRTNTLSLESNYKIIYERYMDFTIYF
jgi:hypothetical protein